MTSLGPFWDNTEYNLPYSVERPQIKFESQKSASRAGVTGKNPAFFHVAKTTASWVLFMSRQRGFRD